VRTARHRRHSTPFDPARSLSLDRLRHAEELALGTWAEIVADYTRHDGEQHPMIDAIARTAWKAYNAIATQRAACERAWKVPR
jgi:hypothetical protein